MTGNADLPRQRSIGVACPAPVGLIVQNLDTRPTFLDVERGDQGQRVVIDPGDEFTCTINPGPATITCGHGLAHEFIDLEGGGGD